MERRRTDALDAGAALARSVGYHLGQFTRRFTSAGSGKRHRPAIQSAIDGDYTRGGATLFLKVQNLFNQNFQQFVGFPDPGRWVTGGLRWRL
jgi:hypothetical protein